MFWLRLRCLVCRFENTVTGANVFSFCQRSFLRDRINGFHCISSGDAKCGVNSHGGLNNMNIITEDFTMLYNYDKHGFLSFTLGII